MSEYNKHGQATIFSNKDATEENKRPNLSGSIEIKEDIPAGTMLRIAGWLNYQGDEEVVKKAKESLTKAKWSIGMNLSSKIGGEQDNTYQKQTSGSSYEVSDEDIPF